MASVPNVQSAVPDQMSFTGNVAENWKLWLQRFNIYVLATQKSNIKPKVLTALLLNFIGEEGIQIYNSFSFENDKDVENFDMVVERFQTYFEPQKNVVFERFKFYKCVQKPGQTFNQFLTELKSLASSCEFMNMDEMVRDRIVMGIENGQTQERLVRQSELTLKSASLLCRATEFAKLQHEEIESKFALPAVQEFKRPQRRMDNHKRQDHENGKSRTISKNQEPRKRESRGRRNRRSQSKPKSSSQEQQLTSFQQPQQQPMYPPPPPPGVLRLPPPRPFPPGMMIPMRPPFPPPMGAWRPARPPMQAPSGWPYPRPRPFYYPY